MPRANKHGDPEVWWRHLGGRLVRLDSPTDQRTSNSKSNSVTSAHTYRVKYHLPSQPTRAVEWLSRKIYEVEQDLKEKVRTANGKLGAKSPSNSSIKKRRESSDHTRTFERKWETYTADWTCTCQGQRTRIGTFILVEAGIIENIESGSQQKITSSRTLNWRENQGQYENQRDCSRMYTSILRDAQ